MGVFTPALTVSALLVAGAGVRYGTQEPHVTGTYSTLRVAPETGDLEGVEITIVRSRYGYHAMVQTAEGAAEAPVLVTVAVRDSTIEFEAPSVSKLSRVGRFTGVVSGNELRGRFANGWAVVLPRKQSYWQ